MIGLINTDWDPAVMVDQLRRYLTGAASSMRTMRIFLQPTSRPRANPLLAQSADMRRQGAAELLQLPTLPHACGVRTEESSHLEVPGTMRRPRPAPDGMPPSPPCAGAHLPRPALVAMRPPPHGAGAASQAKREGRGCTPGLAAPARGTLTSPQLAIGLPALANS